MLTEISIPLSALEDLSLYYKSIRAFGEMPGERSGHCDFNLCGLLHVYRYGQTAKRRSGHALSHGKAIKPQCLSFDRILPGFYKNEPGLKISHTANITSSAGHQFLPIEIDFFSILT